jgi:hypothetical protein
MQEMPGMALLLIPPSKQNHNIPSWFSSFPNLDDFLMNFVDFCGENIAKTHELFRVMSCTSLAMRPGSWRMIIEKDLQRGAELGSRW